MELALEDVELHQTAEDAVALFSEQADVKKDRAALPHSARHAAAVAR